MSAAKNDEVRADGKSLCTNCGKRTAFGDEHGSLDPILPAQALQTLRGLLEHLFSKVLIIDINRGVRIANGVEKGELGAEGLCDGISGFNQGSGFFPEADRAEDRAHGPMGSRAGLGKVSRGPDWTRNIVEHFGNNGANQEAA